MITTAVKQSKAHEMPAPQAEMQPPMRAVPAPMVEPEALDPAKWDMAASQLVSAMLENFGKPTLPVYVTPGKSIEDMEMAAALRNALRDHGVEISNVRGMSPYALSYMVIKPMNESDGRKLVKIILNDYDKKIAEESGLFDSTGGTMKAVSNADSHMTGDKEMTPSAAPQMSGEMTMDDYDAMAREQDEKMEQYGHTPRKEYGDAMPVPLTSSLDDR